MAIGATWQFRYSSTLTKNDGITTHRSESPLVMTRNNDCHSEPDLSGEES